MKLLILDLDETLIFSAERPLDRAPDFTSGPYFVYKRPGVDEFIERASRIFRLAVWTSSNDAYAESVVEKLFKDPSILAFVWSRDRCTPMFDPASYTHEFAKNLNKVKKLGFDLSDVVMVDDTPIKIARHYGNLVRVRSYLGEQADNELDLLEKYLKTIAAVENIRGIEKRNWRAAVDVHRPN
jgi:TFIIF-interacting CTD phosphatase-like protein